MNILRNVSGGVGQTWCRRLLLEQHVNAESRRHLWRWLNSVFNRPDRSRIKEVGPDRACAEWLLRCGAHVRWQVGDRWQTDYNSLPTGGFKELKIEEINADEAAIMSLGFPHFDGVCHVKRVRFHSCPYMEDEALQELGRLKDTLLHLQVSSCGDVTDAGVASLAQLTLLQTLLLYDLPEVRDKQGVYNHLKKALPKCEIDYKDLNQDVDKQAT